MTGTDHIELDRERSLRAILGAAARLYAKYPLLFLILAVGVIAPWDIAVLAASGHGPLYHGRKNAWESLFGTLAQLALISPLVSALHVHAVRAIGDGLRPRLSAVALQGLRVLPVVGAAAIVSGLGIIAGFLALIVPGILLALRWAVVAQAASLEGVGWIDALRSSAKLTAKNYGHVFGVLFVGSVIGDAIKLGARAVTVKGSATIGAVILGIAADTVVASFAALTLALLYFDLKARDVPPAAAPREHPHLRDLDP